MMNHTKMRTANPLPLFRDQLKEKFGILSFNCILINVDLIGMRSLKTGEVVIITYRGKDKTGFMYEGGNLTTAQQKQFFDDAPDDINDLKNFEKEMVGRIEILVPPKDNYVFIDENLVKNK